MAERLVDRRQVGGQARQLAVACRVLQHGRRVPLHARVHQPGAGRRPRQLSASVDSLRAPMASSIRSRCASALTSRPMIRSTTSTTSSPMRAAASSNARWRASCTSVAKLLALPEFIVVVVVARLLGAALRARGLPALRLLLVAKVTFLLAFFVLAVVFGPFPDSDAPAALLAGFAGIAGMAVQNAVQRVHYSSLPPTTLMTGNTTQAALDAVDLLHGGNGDLTTTRARFGRTVQSIGWFAGGCALAAALYYWIGFWSLAVPVAVGATTAILGQD